MTAQDTVVTVCGEVSSSSLGPTSSHEHILFDARMPQALAGSSYADILDDEQLAIDEVQLFRDQGGATICDPTNIGLSRDPEALRRISEATGVHIIMGCGWYREVVYPGYVHERSVSALAEQLVLELTDGVGDAKVRAGFIGEIGTERGYITPAQERVFRAAGRASGATGAPIVTHTTHWGELALQQLELLAEEGIAPDRVVISHLGDRRDIAGLLAIARAGPWLSIDNLGGFDYIPLEVRARNVLSLWEAGFGDRIVLGNDVCSLPQLKSYGGGGYGYVLSTVVPVLASMGLEPAAIEQMLVGNPLGVIRGGSGR